MKNKNIDFKLSVVCFASIVNIFLHGLNTVFVDAIFQHTFLAEQILSIIVYKLLFTKPNCCCIGGAAWRTAGANEMPSSTAVFKKLLNNYSIYLLPHNLNKVLSSIYIMYILKYDRFCVLFNLLDENHKIWN